ncbi:MAG TPA: phytanoyl-CoA dioxygenase family protein, partial [Burkholderiales bacterium]|nr:phytanoyl-CoA dioxygenase family protein [Burkholderiales bacterium]
VTEAMMLKRLRQLFSRATRFTPRSAAIGPKRAHSARDTSVPAAWRSEWQKKGYVILPGLYSPEAIRQHLDIVVAARKDLPDGKDEYGYGDRIGQLHQKHPELIRLAADPRVLGFLRWAFDDDPLLFGSLNFDRGTQQELHIDAIFFYTEPAYAMAGLWIALEDVHPDAGPLFYVPGSHRWPFFRGEDVLARDPELAQEVKAASAPDSGALRGDLVARLGRKWTELTLEMEKERGGERVPAVLKAGDAVIWHALLAHGGLPRINPALSRKSAVFHYIGENARLYTFEEFFLKTSAALLAQPGQRNERASRNGLRYINYDYFVTYDAGEEKVHRL